MTFELWPALKKPIVTRWDAVNVRDFQESEIECYVNYWHDESNRFLDEMGVIRSRLGSKKKMTEQMVHNLNHRKRSFSILTIVYNGNPVGIHELTDLIEGESAVMHAHLWSQDMRGKGLGSVSYIKAMGIYFERYKLNRIVFKTPVINTAANRIKEKLNIQACGICQYYTPVLKEPVDAVYYEVSRPDYQRILADFLEK